MSFIMYCDHLKIHFLGVCCSSVHCMHALIFGKNFVKATILLEHTATADPRKVYFKVVTEPKETYQFQKVYYFPD